MVKLMLVHVLVGVWSPSGARGPSQYERRSYRVAIPMLKIRRPNDRLIFNMEIAIRR